MPTVSARIGVIALAFVTLFPTSQAAQAFGLNFGPFHLYAADPWPASPRGANRAVRDRGPAARLAAERLAADCLRRRPGRRACSIRCSPGPRSTTRFSRRARHRRWSFGYQNIFDQAFAKYPPQRSADLCPYRDRTAEIVGRITQETSPDAKQQPLLQKLATALGQANGYLIKSCPTEIPAPAGRALAADGQPARRHDHGAGDRAAAVASFRAILER